MPVRTRSQRLKEEQSSSSEEAKQTVHKSGVSKWKKANRKPEKEELEQKTEEITAYKSNVDEIRKYVKNILDSPNKVDLPSTRNRNKKEISSTPRVDRITINEDQPEQMEFLIPPKHHETPMEIRQKVRSVLSPDCHPSTVPFRNFAEKSPSYPPMYNETTKLWTPNAPSYNEEEADRISRLLIMFIFTILIAVFFAYYQEEIILMVRSQLNELNPMVQSLRQQMESLTAYGSTVWSSLWSNNEEANVVDDTVTK